MTDREMLEMAARAAGIEVWFPRMSDGKGGVFEPCHTLVNGQTQVWNPFDDDGLALRLVVKLGITVYTNIAHAYVRLADDTEVSVAEEPSTDPYAATRRAIVRAAAEIGRQMEVQS